VYQTSRRTSTRIRCIAVTDTFFPGNALAFHRCTNMSSCRLNQLPSLRQACSQAIESYEGRSYSKQHSPKGRRPRPSHKQRERMWRCCQIRLSATHTVAAFAPSLTNRSTRTPTLAMASPSLWPMLVPCGPIGPPAPVNSGVRPLLNTRK
jgi:hypothetical protein